MNKNKVKHLLYKGEPVAIPEINHIFSPKIIEILGMLGYQCVWIDMEHSTLDYERLSDMALTARSREMDVIVRIAKGGYTPIIKCLEAGASGLVLPHCMSSEEAKDFVRMAKFSPVGLRGVGCGVDSEYGTEELVGFMREANQETLLVAQIEDREAVERLDAIAATEEIDALFIGPADLCQSYGVSGQLEHPVVLEAIGKVAAASKKYGKSWGTRIFSDRQMKDMLKKGARFLNITSDNEILMKGLREALEKSKEQFARL